MRNSEGLDVFRVTKGIWEACAPPSPLSGSLLE